MDLTFVDNNSAIDTSKRSTIRRQAAKGRNLGRKINRPSRLKALQSQSQARPIAVSSSQRFVDSHVSGWSCRLNHVPRGCPCERPKMEPVIGDSISILSLPIEVAQEDRILLHAAVGFMRSPRFAPSLAKALDDTHEAHSIFLQSVFTDQAYFHCIIAIVAESTSVVPNWQALATKHIAKSFHLMNERISSAEHITTQMLAVAMVLSARESTRCRHDYGMVHMSGLFRMIEMRGGLKRVALEEPEIMQKVYRADLDYSLRLETHPKLDIRHFENANETMTMLDMDPLQEHKELLVGVVEEFREQLGPDLFWLWDKAEDISLLVNEACTGKRAKLLAKTFMRSHVWLGHRLLTYAPLGRYGSLSSVQGIAHLGLLTFVSSFLCGLNRLVPENTFLSRQIRNIATDASFSGNEEIMLWLLFLGGAVTLQDPAHDAWLLPTTSHLMRHFGLCSWKHTKKILSKYPWIDDFYEKEGSSLFNRIICYRCTLSVT